MTAKSQTTVKTEAQPSLNTDKSGLLQRKCECGNAAGLMGQCSECQNKRLPRYPKNSVRNESAPVLHDLIQPKLVVGPPGDKYEQEADYIAEQVVRLPNLNFSQPHSEPAIAPNFLQLSLVQRLFSKHENKGRRYGESQVTEPHPKLDRVESTLRQTGRPLDLATRNFFEPRLGFDLGNVRIHTDASAALSANDIKARAYTYRHNIVFNTGQYAPHTRTGQLLLAHELVHVMQQSLTNKVHRYQPWSDSDSHDNRSKTTTTPTRSGAEKGTEQGNASLDWGSPNAGNLSLGLRLTPSPATIHRAVETYCLAPSEVPTITPNQASNFGRIAEVPIVMDYCRAMGGCALMVSDYIDTDASSYIAFLAANNSHLTTQDIIELAIAATVTGGLSRPDVITHKPPRFEFEEVKPDSISGRLAGRIKLASLASLFARFSLPYLPGTTWSGTGNLPLFTLPGGVTVSLVWHRNLPGLVVYNICVRGEASVLAAYGVAAILIAVILILLTRGRIIIPGGGGPLPIPAFASAEVLDTDQIPQGENEPFTEQARTTELA